MSAGRRARDRGARALLVLLAAACSTPSRCTSPACAFAAAGAPCAAAWVRGRRARRCGSRATVGAPARVEEGEPVAVEIEVVTAGAAAAGRRASLDPLLPAPRAAGRRPARDARAHRRALRAPRAQGAAAAARRGARPARACRARLVAGGGRPDEVLVLPARGARPCARLERRRAGTAAAGAALARRGAEVELDGLRPHAARARPRRASTGRRWPRGGELLERRLRAEGDTRPLVVLDLARRRRRGGRSTPRCAPPPRWPSHLAHARRLRAAAARASGGPLALDPALRGWPHAARAPRAASTTARARASRRSPPAAGRSLYVAARRARREPPRALAHAPGGRAGCSSCPARWPGGAGALRRRRLHRLRHVRAPARQAGAPRSSRSGTPRMTVTPQPRRTPVVPARRRPRRHAVSRGCRALVAALSRCAACWRGHGSSRRRRLARSG